MVSPGSGLGASSTGSGAGSIVRPWSPTTVDNLKFKFNKAVLNLVAELKSGSFAKPS